MKPSMTLRLTLTLTFLVSVIAAYYFLFDPEIIQKVFPDTTLDIVHTHLAILVGLFFIVFAAAALLGLINPIKNASAILILILLHFGGFVTDIVLLAKGTVLPLKYLFPDMAYTLIICIILIRYYPTEAPPVDMSKTADELVGAVQKQLKKEAKAERKEAPAQKSESWISKISSKLNLKSK